MTHETSALPPDLHGFGLRLRLWGTTEAEAETYLRGFSDSEFQRWNTPLHPIADLASARARLRTKHQAAMSGTAASFCVSDATTGTVLGSVSINNIDRATSSAVVGYWVLPEARGQGLAGRALTLAAHWAFTDLGLHRLELKHAVGHEASCRVAERCGFRLEGTLRDAMWEAGRRDAFRDCHLHARLATDQEPR